MYARSSERLPRVCIRSLPTLRSLCAALLISGPARQVLAELSNLALLAYGHYGASPALSPHRAACATCTLRVSSECQVFCCYNQRSNAKITR